jgi:hypothetical protein
MDVTTDRATRHRGPLVIAAAAFVAAGGYVHAREWLDGYRDVPAAAPGAFLVRVGFPLNAAMSLLVAVTLVATLFVARRRAPVVVAGAMAFQAVSLAVLIGTRVGSVLGWTEPVWTRGADQARAVGIGAIVALVGVVAVSAAARRMPVALAPIRSGRALPPR